MKVAGTSRYRLATTVDPVGTIKQTHKTASMHQMPSPRVISKTNRANLTLAASTNSQIKQSSAEHPVKYEQNAGPVQEKGRLPIFEHEEGKALSKTCAQASFIPRAGVAQKRSYCLSRKQRKVQSCDC